MPLIAQNDTNQWTVALEEDPDTKDLLLPFPQDLIEQTGWEIGDTLQWIDNKDGTYSIVKLEKIDDDIRS